MNHYPRHVGDFIRDTVGLSLAERGAYTALLDQYYASEKPLPLDARERYRMAGANSKLEREAVDYIVARYFIEYPDGLHQKRADQEIAAYKERSSLASTSAQARWSKRNANAMRTHSDGNANQNQEPEPVSKRSKTKPSSATPPDLPVSAELWEQFREMRRKVKAPLTPYGEGLLVAELGRMAAAGHDATATVEQSIKRGWKGFFPVDRGNGKDATRQEKRAANMDDLCGRKHGRTIDAEPVDRTTLRPALSDLREPDDDDVERLPKGGHH